MFKRIYGLLFLLILFSNIYQVLGVNHEGFIENNGIITNFDDNNSMVTVDQEIEPIIDENYQSYSDIFQSSPLSIDEQSSSVTTKISSYSDKLVLNIDLESQIIAPNEPLGFTIQAKRGLSPAAGETLTWEIIEGEYWGWYYYYSYEPRSERIVHSKTITTDSNGEWSGSLTTETSGRYSIIVRSESESTTRYRAFTVASIGLFWRVPYEFVPDIPHSSIAYVLNTTDFSPISSADVELVVGSYSYNYNTSQYEYYGDDPLSWQTNDQGVVGVEFTPSKTLSAEWSILANLSATFNGETVYVIRDLYRGGYSWDWSGNYQTFKPYEFIITTDKPIYLPTETINTRILVWKNDYYKAIKEPVETEVTVKFLSPSQHILFQKVMSTDEHGIISYTFSLDPDTELGDYYIYVEKGEDSEDSVKIRVDKYEKPAFRVTLNLDQEYVAPGNVLSGNVTAEYYFGRPVANGQIELLIGDFEVLSGTTDINGFWEFRHRLPDEDEIDDETSIPINVTVTDTVGREVSTSDNIQITDYIYVWSYVNPWFPKVDETITVYFGAYQVIGTKYWWWNWEPVTNVDVDITLYGVSDTGENSSLAKFDSFIGDSGRGSYEFNLTQSMLANFIHFRLFIEIVSNDRREGSDITRFSVDRNSLKLALDSTIYEPKDDVELSVEIVNRASNEQVEGTVLLRVYDPDFDLIVETEEKISKYGEVLAFNLSSKAPGGKYRLWIYLETEVSYEWGSRIIFRSPTTLEFSVGSPQEISLSSDKEKYSTDESIALQCSLDGNTNAPIMVQFVKRGIVATEFIDLPPTDSFTLEIDKIEFLAPYFWVYVYAILDDGTILDTYLKIEVDSTIQVEITSDRSVYEPGDTANVAIRVFDAKDNPISAVLAVSFVDSSVYGVEPDPESENDHFDDSSYWPSVLTVTSWKGRQELWWFWWYEEYYVLQGGIFWGYEDTFFYRGVPMEPFPESGQGVKDQDSDTSQEEQGKDVRDNLPENAFWNPRVIVESGSWEMEITLPDNIGEWTVRVVTTTEAGAGVLEKETFKTFLPFFVEINKDPYVLQDDVFILRGIVYNYLEEVVNITLRLDTEEGVLLLGYEYQHLRLPSGFLGSIGWACLAEGSGFFNVTLYGNTTVLNGTEFKDAIRKPLNVIPNGVSFEARNSGFITSNPSFVYDKYEEVVQATEFLQLTLGFGTAAISSWERLVGYPYGCIEQTTSKLIPDALVLQYLAEIDQLDNETEEELLNMLVTGLSRLYSFQHKDGGWGWWYDDESKVFMTSLAVYCLGLINNTGLTIDPAVIEKGLQYLTAHQRQDGYWEPDSWRNIDQTAFTAVILRSILAFKGLISSDVINDAIDYIELAWNDPNKQSTYLAGLYLTSVPESGFGKSTFTTNLLDYLEEKAEYSSKGCHWTYSTEDNNWWRSLGGDIEITALALQALVVNDAGPYMHIIQRALEWLLDKQSYYGWGNTADTAAAITSLIVVNSELSGSNEDTTVAVYVRDDQLVGNYSLSISSQASIYIKLSDILVIGTNQFEFVKYGSGNVSYYFQGSQVLRSLPSIEIPDKVKATPNSEVSVEISLSPQSSNVFASDLSVAPIKGDITPFTNLGQDISLLTHKTSIFYDYEAPSKIGIYLIPGFEITYQLADAHKEEESPGVISRRYGPVQLEVVEKIEGVLFSPPQAWSPPRSSVTERRDKIVQDGLGLERTYSKSTSYQKGDLVIVTLSITNPKQEENFIMLEDSIPSGFDLDLSTIVHPDATYEITSSGIAFFFPELATGSTEVSYGIIAMDVRQSLVPPAQLSSMYHDWTIHSTSEILGSARIPIDPSTGSVIKDMDYPVIKNLKLEEGVHSDKAVLKVAVDTVDNWGVASVRVFVEQEAWGIYECLKGGDTWTVQIFSLHDGPSQIYFEVIDLAGNTKIGEITEKYLDLDSLIIPVFPILTLVIVAVLAASVASVTVRRKTR